MNSIYLSIYNYVSKKYAKKLSWQKIEVKAWNGQNNFMTGPNVKTGFRPRVGREV